MKIFFISACMFFAALTVYANGIRDEMNLIDESDSGFQELGKDGSYALGLIIGACLRSDNIMPVMKEFIRGIKDNLYDFEPRYSMEEAYRIFNDSLNAFEEETNQENKKASIEFLEENGKKPGVYTTGSGLQYEVLIEGNGPKPTATDKVRVHYEGTLIDGTVFDSSRFRIAPIEFSLDKVIAGWTEGVQLMNVGSTYRLFIPPELGYGDIGDDKIAPFSVLIFEVELFDIVQKNETEDNY